METHQNRAAGPNFMPSTSYIISFNHDSFIIHVLLSPLRPERLCHLPWVTLLVSEASICIRIYVTLKNTLLGGKNLSRKTFVPLNCKPCD